MTTSRKLIVIATLCMWFGELLKACSGNTHFQKSLLDRAKSRLPVQNVEDHVHLHLLNTKLCGVTKNITAVRNGKEAHLFELPWIALIGYENTSSKLANVMFYCIGSVINKRYVLTAAHCLDVPKEIKPAYVRVGEYDWSRAKDFELTDENTRVHTAFPHQDVGIEEIRVHSQFSNVSRRNDIALLRLNRTLKFTSTVRPICLPMEPLLQSSAEAGYGSISTWNLNRRLASGSWTEGFSSVPIIIDVPLMSLGECNEIYENKLIVPIWHKQMCSGNDPDYELGFGSSGGPLQQAVTLPSRETKTVQLGVISFGIGNTPTVYTNLAYYVEWILDNISL